MSEAVSSDNAQEDAESIDTTAPWQHYLRVIYYRHLNEVAQHANSTIVSIRSGAGVQYLVFGPARRWVRGVGDSGGRGSVVAAVGCDEPTKRAG